MPAYRCDTMSSIALFWSLVSLGRITLTVTSNSSFALSTPAIAIRQKSDGPFVMKPSFGLVEPVVAL